LGHKVRSAAVVAVKNCINLNEQAKQFIADFLFPCKARPRTCLHEKLIRSPAQLQLERNTGSPQRRKHPLANEIVLITFDSAPSTVNG
jgi:hypothetical protein